MVFRDPVIFDKNHFSKPSSFVFLSEYFSKTFLEHIVDCFGLDELPVVLKNPQPHVSLIFYSFKFPKGTDIFLFRCQSRVSSVPCARTRPSRTALSVTWQFSKPSPSLHQSPSHSPRFNSRSATMSFHLFYHVTTFYYISVIQIPHVVHEVKISFLLPLSLYRSIRSPTNGFI